MGQAIKKNKVEYIDRVHGNSKGWITRSCIDENGYSQWHYKYLELKETDLTGENIYITLNTFYKPCRRLECIKELNINNNKTEKFLLTKENKQRDNYKIEILLNKKISEDILQNVEIKVYSEQKNKEEVKE